MRLDGKVCFVTGGGSGMGRVAAAMFCAEGARVAVADVNAEACESAAEAARQGAAGAGDAFALPCDVTRDSEVREAIAATVDALRRAARPLQQRRDHAGGRPLRGRHRRVRCGTASWPSTSRASISAAGTASPRCSEPGGGSVVNIASFVALVGCTVPQDAYTASKGAVIALTQSLAVQFAPAGRAHQRDLPRADRDAAPDRVAADGPRGEGDCAWPATRPGGSGSPRTS